jgi:dTDP-4-amino-4,6-dideoxygalactose transaminase
MDYIPYGKQFIDKEDKKSVLNSLSNDLITTGPLVEKFEKELNKYLKCKYSYVCSSGTAAIHLAMLAIGLKKDDVILMPAVNFIASYNLAKIMQLKVFLVDVDEYTGQITPNKIIECIEKNKLIKISVLLTMYMGGFPENVQNLYTLRNKYKFLIIEDACHALGSKYLYKKKVFKIGSCKHADISTFSMHPLKTITSGEGGIITTNNLKIAKNIKLLRSHGIVRNKRKHWKYDILKHGFNYRLSDINCALGISQLKKIDFFVKERKKIYEKYLLELKNFHPKLKIPEYSKKINSSYHLLIVNIIFSKLNKSKDQFMNYLIKHKIIAQQHYVPVYKFSIYKEEKNSYPGSEKYFKNSLSLPIFVNLNKKNQNKVIKVIKNFLDN